MRKGLLLVVLAATASICIAQETATLAGRVLDKTGAAVAGAELVLTNVDTNIESRTTTGKEGLYVFSGVRPGRYRLAAGASGFAVTVKKDLVLHVQDELAENFVLQVGSVNETVTVTGGSSLVNTESGAVGTVVDRQFVENLPLNGRSFQSLILLTPGIVVSGGNASAGGFSVNGQRNSANSFTVDGVSANFAAQPTFFGGSYSSGNLPGLTTLGTTQSMASVDAVQEFKVQTSTYSAENGRQPGGQVSIVTRSGTNQFHGNLFEYFRNDALDANDWFADRAGTPKQAERQNDFGGTLGGPVVVPHIYNGRNRTFFFVSYEGLRLRLPNFALTNVPSLCLRGLGSCAAGQVAAPAAIQPALAAFPLPNGKEILANGVPIGLAEFSAGYSDPSNLDATSFRIDHTISSKLSLFVRYNKAPSAGITRNALNLSALTDSQLRTQTITLGVTALLTPRISNELRANHSGNGAYAIGEVSTFGGAVPAPRNLLIPAQFDTPAASGGILLNPFTGRTSTGAPNAATGGTTKITSQRQFNIVDNLTWSVGSHRLKFGIDYRKLTPVESLNPYGINALFANQAQVQSLAPGTIAIASNIALFPEFTNLSFYGQDTWKVSRRLTLDLGLRWDVNPAPKEANGHDELALTQIDNLATMALAPIGTPAWNTTYKNFAPRLGLAYQLSQAAGRETVLRGGVGIFYDIGDDQGAANFLAVYPYSGSRTIAGNTTIKFPFTDPVLFAPGPILANSPLVSPYPFFNAFDPNLKLPYTWQWNVAVEQSLGSNQSLTLSYVGAAGRNLLQATQLTLNAAAAPINPKFTTLFLTQNAATSDYDSLQAKFQRRLSRGLQVLASYTWSHALDSDSSSFVGKVAVRGNAAFDVRHVFATALTYDIPAPSQNRLVREVLGHWSTDTSFHAQSGYPFDIVGSTRTNVDGTFVNVRPNVNPGVPFYVNDPTVPGGRKVNPLAFTPLNAAQVAAGLSGNFGRNQVRGLGAWQQDFAARREFRLTEGLKLQFRAEAFNIFNHPNFGGIQTTLGSSNFGQATNMLNRQLGGISQLYQIGGPRSLQMALKLIF